MYRSYTVLKSALLNPFKEQQRRSVRLPNEYKDVNSEQVVISMYTQTHKADCKWRLLVAKFVDRLPARVVMSQSGGKGKHGSVGILGQICDRLAGSITEC